MLISVEFLRFIPPYLVRSELLRARDTLKTSVLGRLRRKIIDYYPFSAGGGPKFSTFTSQIAEIFQNRSNCQPTPGLYPPYLVSRNGTRGGINLRNSTDPLIPEHPTRTQTFRFQL